MAKELDWQPCQQLKSRAMPYVCAEEQEEIVPKKGRLVYVVTPSLFLGGAERMAYVLSAGLKSRGYETVLCDVSRDGMPDVSEAWATIWWGELLWPTKPIRSIYVAHRPGDVPLSQVDLIIGVCSAAAGDVRIWNGLPRPPRRRRDRSNAEETMVIGYLGRYVEGKGLRRVIAALPMLPERIRFHSYGSGPLRHRLLLDAERRGVEDRVSIGGVTQDTTRALGEMDALILASESEGCPLAIVEAMLAGCPVIATAVGDIPDLLDDGRGVIVGRAPRDIANAAAAMCDSPHHAREMATVAKEWASSNLSVEKMLDGYEEAMLAASPDVSDQITAFLVSSGEESTAECRRLLQRQSIKPRIVEIFGVTPMDRAFQEMHKAETPFFVQVDADMLLNSTAVETLYDGILGRGEMCAEWVGWLWGDAEGEPIQGCKIYRTEIAKQYPYKSSVSCEWGPMEAMKRDGYMVEAGPRPIGKDECVGLHYSLQSQDATRKRWHRLMGKLRRDPVQMAYFGKFPRIIAQKYEQNQSHLHLAMLEGIIAGLCAPLPADREMDASYEAPEVRRLNWMLGEASAGPQELALYMTSRCSHACSWCRRSIHGASDAPDVTPRLVENALKTWPTITNACLAGFGEPLLAEHLDEVLAILQQSSVYTQVVTNGSPLTKQAKVLARRSVRHIDVSLNATTKSAHRKETGADTWDNVLEGIRAAQDTGMRIAISMVVRRSTVDDVRNFIDLAGSIGCWVHLHGLLPHSGADDPFFMSEVITDESSAALEVLGGLKEEYGDIQTAPVKVMTWPEPISLIPCMMPRRCQSPFVFIGLDGDGAISGCRRVLAPSPSLGEIHPNAWWGPHLTKLRAAMWEDCDLPEHCRGCFGLWKQ